MARLIHISVCTDLHLWYCRSVTRGVLRFAMTRPDWYVLQVRLNPERVLAAVTSDAKGFISHMSQPAVNRVLARTGLPVVNTSGVRDDLPFPRIGVDDDAVGRMAAEHLLQRGLRNFACRTGNTAFGRTRAGAFRAAVAEKGLDCTNLYEAACFQRNPAGFTHEAREARVKMLKSLPKPLGLFVEDDDLAAQTVSDCFAGGLRVPDQVAVVGVNNDEMVCEGARPGLSSVAVPGELIGYRAGETLARLMAGQNVSHTPVLLPPMGVVQRQSTDTVASEYPVVRRALRFMRDHACDGINVADVLDELVVSRSTLDKSFRKCLGRSPLSEIHRLRVERAKRLLSDTEMRMIDIAAACGFSDARRLWMVFRRLTGLPPDDYRGQFRTH